MIFRDKPKDKMYDNFFEHVGNHIIDQNYQGIPVEFEPDTSHIQPERSLKLDSFPQWLGYVALVKLESQF
jgi:hypothetical protein